MSFFSALCILFSVCFFSASISKNELRIIGGFMELQIDFETVGRILGLILATKCGKIRSADEKSKKRQKLTTHHEAEHLNNDPCKIDNPVYTLSSLLDVLLLKKDITNR